MASFLSPLVKDLSRPYRLVNQRTGLTIAERLIPAFDSTTRRTGLLSYTSLPDDSAMVIAPSNAIHTLFMKFPIDVLFVAKNGRVVKVREELAPWRLAGAWGAFCVVEMAAGGLRASATQIDDLLCIEPSGR